MLQALPDTALWHRLEKEGRLLGKSADINQATLMNFVPTRPIEDITEEFIQTFWDLYDPLTVLNRTFRHYLILGEARKHNSKRRRNVKKSAVAAGSPSINWVTLRAFFIIIGRQGILRKTRLRFWVNLAIMLWRYPAVAASYVSVCAQAEHFIDFRQVVRQNIEAQLAAYKASQPAPAPQEEASLAA
jgi:hypothetical protein